MNNKIIISIIIVFVILLLAFCTYNIHNKQYEDSIYGLWVSSDGYNDDADISLMRLFIGHPNISSKKIKRNARLLIDNNITDQDIVISYKNGSSGFPYTIKPYEIITDIEFSKEQVWDSPVTFEFDFLKNSLKIHNGDELLGFLYKDNDLTESFKYVEKNDAPQVDTDDNI